jgi:hypothetical protein
MATTISRELMYETVTLLVGDEFIAGGFGVAVGARVHAANDGTNRLGAYDIHASTGDAGN